MTGWHYLMLVNIYLLLFYGFYVLLLRRETFFQLNRVYLVAASLLSFFIPMIQSNWVQNLFITKEVQLTIYNSPLIVYQFQPIRHTQMTIGQILAIIYLAGIMFLICRFIWQMIVLNKIINQPDSPIAYSFFKKIKLGTEHANNHVIAAHEHVHAKQWHSADVLLIEAVMIVNWFNPIVYLYRFSIKHIHEYIADRQALRSGTTKSDYALLLLSQTFNVPVHQLVNPFYNHSLLKQRIIMLQKNKSNRISLVKYGLSVPLFVLMLILSSATINNSKTVGFVSNKVSQVLLTPASSIQPLIIADSAIAVRDSADKDIEIIEGPSKKAPVIKVSPAGISKDSIGEGGNMVFTSVELVPQYPGGIESFGRYLGKNIHYPAKMREQGVQGKVIIGFIVEKDGSLSGIHVMRSVADELDKEALRVISASSKWKPGIQNGRPVRVAYAVPISFSLVDDDKPDISQREEPPISVNDRKLFSSKPDTNKFSTGVKKKKGIVDPLYMIDGKPADDMTGLKPEDIESVSVLSQAAAKAVYGAKGENGVIIVITKSNTTKPAPAKEPEAKH